MMNGRHLPAGQQNMPQDMGRRRQYNQSHQQQHYQPSGPMYNGYMQPYHPNSYYPPQYQSQYPPQYQHAANPYTQNPYPPHVRSPPPPMQHYGHPPLAQHPYPRPQPSPAVSTPYQQPPPPQTPPSTQSSYTVPGPMTPPTPQTAHSVAASPPPPEPQTSFRAPLPWLSRPDLPYPARRARRKKKQSPELSADPVELPTNVPTSSVEIEEPIQSNDFIPRPETPLTSQPTSEQAESTNPTTPSSAQAPSIAAPGEITPVAPKAPKPAAPALPIIPAMPKALPKELSRPTSQKSTEEPQPQTTANGEEEQPAITVSDAPENPGELETKVTAPAPKAWSVPKSWTGVFNPASGATSGLKSGSSANNTPGFGKANTESLADTLKSYNAISNDSKVAFIEPRGLVNTGNMCYMNSVLQVLVFCAPFYNFLDQVGKRAVHSFKSDTPLIEAMIMFMREFPIIDSAVSVEQLKLRLKDAELQQYGGPFTPHFVYDVMKRLPRFVSMERGQQQDAEEFLGFLLDVLHEECVQVMRGSSSNGTSAVATPTNAPASPVSEVASIAGPESQWTEVVPKQKAAITRSSGTIATDSPLTKIFGGKLRSELRVQGKKNSVTLEPYQPLQLDIGSPDVHNISDALKGLTRSETVQGDFNSPKGVNATAYKQIFIETLPPVLILHLKRFQYDNTGGTQKIWKKVGYPLELEIPKEVFPPSKRAGYSLGGLPKYRLTGVVYHHGIIANSGHYTVDVRRQDEREWIRLNDTVITRIRSEDVAEGGSEEDSKTFVAALEAQKKDPSSGNTFSTIEESTNGSDWKTQKKKYSSVVNGASTPKKTEKFSGDDNDHKVAYLLFYQKI